MRILKIICDVCGKDYTKEYEKKHESYKYTIGGFSVHDLCFECFHIINKFITELKK
jgi:hypothetical protein